jgi:hypothetical protein
MRLPAIAVALIGVMMAGCNTTAGIRSGTAFTKVVLDGKPLKVDAYYSLNPDCTTVGLATVRVVAAPQGGTIDVRHAPDFPGYPTGNPRSHCNTQRVPMTTVFYVPRPEYKGPDSFRIETVFATGNAQVVTYRVDVR